MRVSVCDGGICPRSRTARTSPTRLTPNLPTDAYSEFDAFGSYNFGTKYQLRGGIDNLFDVDPAIVGATRASATTVADSNSASTLPGIYDVLGRRYYVGINIKF